jgi:hypothetical protein
MSRIERVQATLKEALRTTTKRENKMVLTSRVHNIILPSWVFTTWDCYCHKTTITMDRRKDQPPHKHELTKGTSQHKPRGSKVF